MQFVGYEYLRQRLSLSAFEQAWPAVVRPVTRITPLGDCLAVPAERAPGDDLLEHLQFALKHEGVDLAVLAEALPHVPAEALVLALRASPNGIYLRKLAFLYEAFVGELDHEPAVRSRVVPLFDPEHYVTGPSIRNGRWRIDFNGLGSLAYCATVRRTLEVNALLAEDVLVQARAFMEALPPGMLDRATQWAYLSETQSSFAIERESLSPDKQQRFMQLLYQAHEGRALDEAYLVTLQNSTVSNPFDMAAAFRHEQNYLHNGLPGALGVSYLPPPPRLCDELMQRLMEWANEPLDGAPSLVAAAVISFGFVFLHPFMDGNGRISRFLIHHRLCRAGQWKQGHLLPISVAMKRHEEEYLAALEAFSKPARQRWRVSWIDADHYDFEFVGSDTVYRYWDATPAVAFTLRMARAALEQDLMAETRYLACFDRVYRDIDQRFDIRGSDLAWLVMMCLSQDGRLSSNRRKQFRHQVPAEVLDAIEDAAREALYHSQEEDDWPTS
ncbi:Fic family protein [Billgrantia endophytica]|uniref:Cell filamentation protein Fic n=1 Tax=Billgrantia endophytica TaxID=2033802 RepID=A0A2N7TXY1_9GAMM|nr:Fic family protein [Halomonas endophytica]PMR73038.1 cell filamentation protein Fic [Halomonas endophytica]